ncbi:chemotaxis protein CheX [Luteimonas deserti]|uniref:Chemotaxis protein CheX n=1 Tax=Luteimonas deserti TaxID=2752306 RepID=A0A7Z0TYI1_9GAMM|nr:chemotaxis protein CheX [Luteimonas deserti]NYZ62945.1 chemotaxis protein CheX [Luteimonas deserti]
MAAKFLGQFLLERGVITAPQLLAAIEAQRASNPLLGELAVSRGLLDDVQARRIHQRQRVEDRRFGDIALELGVLDQAQLDGLLEAQKAGRRMLGQVLVDQGALDAAQLEAEVALHRADQVQARDALDSVVGAHPLGALADNAIALCARLFPRMLGSQCQAAAVLGAQDLADASCVAHVRVEGDRPFGIGLACDIAAARALACALLTIPDARCDDALALDALGEMVNVLMGYVVRDALSDDDAHYRALPPDTSVPAARIAAATDRSLAVRLESQLGRFVLLVDRPA